MYPNEWSSATPRSNGFCTEAAHDVGNVTWPIRSPAVCARGVETETASMTATAIIAAAAPTAVRRFIGDIARVGRFIPRSSVSQRIRAQLEVHDERTGERLARRAGTRRVGAFDVHRRAVAGRHPQSPALPPGLRIIDATVDALGEKAHRIRHAQLDDLSIRQGVQRIRKIAGADRNVLTQAENVVLIDPRVVRALGGALSASEGWPGNRIERPALGAQVPFRGTRSIERPLALAAIEAGDVSARQGDPCSPLSIDVEPAHSISRRRDFVDFGERGLGWIRSELHANDPTRVTDVRSPDRAIERTVGDAVEPEPDALVLGGIIRLVGFGVRVPLAIAVGVDDERRPALGLPRVARLPEHLRVHPADEGELVLEVVAEPQRVVRILAEIQMVRAEARVDERELLRLRVVHRDLS